MSALSRQAARVGRAAALRAAALAGVAIGAAFLLAALAPTMAAVLGWPMTCLILGLAHIALGASMLLLMGGDNREERDANALPPLAAAFAEGLQKGLAARKP